jgi:cyclopropane-fatty-acyl-phospholipid synthase
LKAAALRLAEGGLVPKPLVRRAIRYLLRQRLEELQRTFGEDRDAAMAHWVRQMRAGPVALLPEQANRQHYELPPELFELVLGARLKYSSAYYPEETFTLDEAEEAMLALTAERAGLADGQEILELGCGWGSLTLWMAERMPRAKILAVSNSAPQRAWINAQAKLRGLCNVEVVTCDMNSFQAPRQAFDRVVSVEMFEHMRNWEKLLGSVAEALRPDGRVFLHVFAHRNYAYPFEVRDSSDWMGEHFFSGGMMPAHDLLDHLDMPLEVEQRWAMAGSHYARTAEDWLRNLEGRREQVLPVLAHAYGRDHVDLWFQRWRIFFLACAELFAFEGGRQWIVSHHRLRHKRARSVRG